MQKDYVRPGVNLWYSGIAFVALVTPLDSTLRGCGVKPAAFFCLRLEAVGTHQIAFCKRIGNTSERTRNSKVVQC